MKKLNKKGFTLTEILATIAILGVVLAIAVPSYNSLSKKFAKSYYEKLEGSILAAAQTYYKDNSNKRPSGYLESSILEFSDLIECNYIDSILEYRDKTENISISEKYSGGLVIIVKVEKGYEYNVCLTGFDDNSTNCHSAWENNENITKCDKNTCWDKSFNLHYDETYQNTSENKEKLKEILKITPSYTKTDENEKELKTISISDSAIYPKDITAITKAKIGNYSLNYDGTNITSTVEVFQYDAPNAVYGDGIVTLSLPGGFGTRYLADQGPATFDHYEYSDDGGSIWKEVNHGSKATTQQIPYTVPDEYSLKFRIVDNYENKGKSRNLEFAIEGDQEPALAVTSILENGDTYTPETWTNKNVTFDITAVLGDESNVLKYSIDGAKSNLIELTDGKSSVVTNVSENGLFNGTYRFYIESSTGVTLKEIEIVVKIDKKPPTLTVSASTESGKSYSSSVKCGLFNLGTCDNWTNESLWLNAFPKEGEGESGIKRVYYKKNLFENSLAEDQNYSDLIDTSYLDNSIKVTAEDYAGNSTTVSIKMHIDKLNPSCSLSVDNTNNQIVYDSHDWEVLTIGLGSGVEEENVTDILGSSVGCKNIINLTKKCYTYKTGNYIVTVEDKAGNKNTCSINIKDSTDSTTTLTPSAPTITLNKSSSSTAPSNTDISFTLSNPNSFGKLQYKIDNGSWKDYSDSAVTLINKTGSATVYARVVNDGKYSTTTNKTGYCNKDIATHERQANGKDTTGCWIQFWMAHNSDYTGNTGVAANRFQYAYWKATETTDTTNKYWGTSSYNSKLSTECGSAPPSTVTIFDSNSANGGNNSKGQVLTKKLYQKYSKQYYCFAIREYRATEITSVNRWKVWYKNASTSNTCSSSAYTGYGG